MLVRTTLTWAPSTEAKIISLVFYTNFLNYLYSQEQRIWKEAKHSYGSHAMVEINYSCITIGISICPFSSFNFYRIVLFLKKLILRLRPRRRS